MPLLTSLLTHPSLRTPLLRTLVPCISLAFGIQAAVAVPSIVARTERFYDLSGSLTYLSCTALSLYLPAVRARVAASGASAALPSVTEALRFLDWRQVALSAAVAIWACRLGTFLFSRITAENGTDSRFDSIRTSPPKFFGAFMAQATWVSLCLLPVLALNAVPQTAFAALPALLSTDVIGLSLYVGGITLEALADRQKSQWMQEKREKKHSEEFLTRGLWGKSRHPNYFGEMTLWSGIALTSAGILTREAGLRSLGWGMGLGSRAALVAMTAASPAFVTFLLTKVSGIPMSETKYDKRYGDREDYKKWKRETPVLFPKFW